MQDCLHSAASTYWNPKGLCRPVAGKLYPFISLNIVQQGLITYQNTLHFVSIYFSCISLNLKARTDFSIRSYNRWCSVLLAPRFSFGQDGEHSSELAARCDPPLFAAAGVNTRDYQLAAFVASTETRTNVL